MLESEHLSVRALSAESWRGVVKVIQKSIKGWNMGLEAELGFALSEAYKLPMNAKPWWDQLWRIFLVVTIHCTYCG